MAIRQPIISMLAHVDHGKTSILDRIRKTVVASREAGAITQHVSASEVPVDVIRSICGALIEKYNIKIDIPGLLFIDLPGHEAFTSLRERGGNLADMAVLVIDISQGMQRQTVECINILKQYKTPFIVAANKIDLIQGWNSTDKSSFTEAIKSQPVHVIELLDKKLYEIVSALAEYGFDSERFDRVTDTTKQLSIVPLSAKTGEGLAELLLLLTGLCQKYLKESLKMEVTGPAKGSVLEIKEEKGLGTTADVIIYDGTLKTGQEILVGGLGGVIRTKVRALMKPVLPGHAKHGEKYVYLNEVSAASGVKIFAPNLDNAISGSPLIAVTEKNIEEAIKRIETQISDAIFESESTGVILKTDSLGSTEAVIKMLRAEKIPIRSAGVGKVTKKDVLEAITVKSLDKYLGVVLSFNAPVTDDAKHESEAERIPIITSNVVYELVDMYKEWVENEKEKDKEMLLVKVQWPCKLRVLPGTCFRTSSPCIFGVTVLEGRIKKGYKLMDEKGNLIGEIRGIQVNKEAIEEAVKGMDVAVSMDRVVFGKDITEGMIMYSIITPDTADDLLRAFKEDFKKEELELIDETLSIVRRAKLKKFETRNKLEGGQV